MSTDPHRTAARLVFDARTVRRLQARGFLHHLALTETPIRHRTNIRPLWPLHARHYDPGRVDAVVQLGRETLVEGRPFTAPKNTLRDGAVMRAMLASLRGFARSWLASPSPEPGTLVYESDAAGLRTWIRVPDRAALLTAPELTTIGFFGQLRDDVDHAPIHQLETAIVETLEEVPGLLSYYNLELPQRRFGNLVLCATPDVPVRWRAHDLHSLAVALAPRHYHSARLHSGTVRSQLLGDAELVVLRTRYYDFDSDPPWLAVRA